MDGVLAPGRHCNDVTGPHTLLHSIHDGIARAADHRPNFVPMLVGVVGELMPFPHQDPDGHAGGLHIQHRKAAPGFFGKHHLALYFVHIGFDVRTLLFIANQNTVTAGSHHCILEAHAEKRNVQFIDGGGVLTAVAQDDIADSRFRQLFGHGVPGADILPHSVILHAENGGFLFHHRIVEADFFQRVITAINGPVVCCAKSLLYNIQKIAQLESEHAAVPQRALGDVLFRLFFGWFLLERADRHHIANGDRHNVPIFLRGIGGFYSQKIQVAVPLFCLGCQAADCRKIFCVHIRVHRANCHCLVRRNAFFAGKIRRRQRNGGEGVPPGGLHTNGHLIAQLVHQCAYLFFAGGHRNSGLWHSSTDLPIHSLHHRFVLLILIF